MERQAGYTFRDCDTCPDMVVIPAGQFFMGSEDNNDESPVHTVRLPTFAIARTEVTQAQWTALMAGNPSHFPECGPNCPVERITWSAAKEYVRRLSEKTGQTYHLPSESEWEYACRAGVEQKYCGGDDLDKVGWLGGMFTLVAKTHPVATKAPNRWGVYDMSGNVAEWVEDCWHGDYQGAPEDGTARTSGECEQRVMRGGCATLAKQFSRATYRSKYYPHLGYFCNGLRPVRVIPPE
jgi:formylglycine-generating enzyme required for sulfatase activity